MFQVIGEVTTEKEKLSQKIQRQIEEFLQRKEIEKIEEGRSRYSFMSGKTLDKGLSRLEWNNGTI